MDLFKLSIDMYIEFQIIYSDHQMELGQQDSPVLCDKKKLILSGQKSLEIAE